MFDIKYSIDTKNLRRKFDSRVSDETKQAANEIYAELVEPWVPYRDEDKAWPGEIPGTLNNDITITPDGITYNAPYAHDRYYGDDEFELSSFTVHPLASEEWDKAAMASGGQSVFNSFVKDLIMDEMRKK